MIEDKRLFEIIDGRGDPVTDAEIAEIVRSAVVHCRKLESDWNPTGAIAFRRGMQGSTWYKAFKALSFPTKSKNSRNSIPFSICHTLL